MLQENYSPNSQIKFNDSQGSVDVAESSYSGFEIEAELDRLKEFILNAARIPLTELAVIDEDFILEQLLKIQENLPVELATAVEIVNHRQQIIEDARGYACLIVKSAEEKAHQIVQESSIVRQAELDGAKLRLKTEQECERLRQNAIAECQAIQKGADLYADNVLQDLEQRLGEMLSIVQNGRQQLERSITDEP